MAKSAALQSSLPSEVFSASSPPPFTDFFILCRPLLLSAHCRVTCPEAGPSSNASQRRRPSLNSPCLTAMSVPSTVSNQNQTLQMQERGRKNRKNAHIVQALFASF
eukprot:620925-Rhodomonas_salina.1